MVPMSSDGRDSETANLLDEQLAYYCAVAPEYFDSAIVEMPESVAEMVHEAMLEALASFQPAGDVLELACGPGTWTGELLKHADRVTAVDGSPEMLDIAAARVRGDERVRFVEADIFSWQPKQRFDAMFFGFWLSHVPLERFDEYWTTLREWLQPDGRVGFVDDAHRTPDELIDGHDSQIIRRRLKDGTPFRAVKVPHTPVDLERRLRLLGWEISARYLGGPFFWGVGVPRS
jgi:demethylmenaquinone methyltransferase/2-methoxy-6-polyprenyl-1,4-benzoquinol methylase